MFTSPQMTDNARVTSLNEDYHPAAAQAQFDATAAWERRRVQKTVEMFGSRRGKWLDVGCAAGVLLTEAQQAGFEPVGFEIHSPYVKHLREHNGWDVRTADSLAAAGFAKHEFDVVSIMHTLNYIPRPVDELRVIKELLAPGGMLLCRVPNARYLFLKNIGPIAYLRFRRWTYLNTEYFLNHFTASSLRDVIERAGFRIVRQEVGQAWLQGSFFNLLCKRTWFRVAQMLSLFGIYLGVSIDVWAVAVDSTDSK